jgi:arylsulfatase A-like enzyme
MPPSFNEADVTDKPTWLKKGYPLLTTAQIDCITLEHRGRVETMMAVDDLIGTVIAALDTAGETADTLIVFTSDNGYGMGEHRVTQKQNAFEEAIRVPLYVRVPGSVTPQVAQQLVVNTDLAPTIVELAQATAGITMDGRSLVPILQDPGFAPWRTGFLVEHLPPPGPGQITRYKALRDVQYMWVEYENGERELYDLATDPDQLTSQHANPAYKAAKTTLRQKLSLLKTCVGAGCWL